MGSPYQTQSASNYNASPPPDDGSNVAANKITWAVTKTKLADPVKSLADAINTQLLTALDVSHITTSINYTTLVSDHLRVIEVTGTTSISLGDASTMTAGTLGYRVTVVNKGVATVTVNLANAANTLDGSVNGTQSVFPGGVGIFSVNQARNGYYSLAGMKGNTWAVPGSIGSTTPNAGAFTTLSASGAVTLTAAGTALSVTNNATIGGTLINTGLITANGGLTVASGQQFQVLGVGPHAIGGPTVPYTGLRVTGTFPGNVGQETYSLLLDMSNGIQAGVNSYGLVVAPTLNKAGSGTHTDFTSATFFPPTINAGAATLTNATTLKITGAPSIGTNLRALWIVAGLSEFGGGATITSGQTLTLTGATVAGAPTWSSTQTMNITGNVTGNCSGTAATVTGAAQAAITSVGTLTGLTMGGTLTMGANTLALASSTVSGTPTWSSNQAITLSTASQPNVTSLGGYTSNFTSSQIAIPSSGTTTTTAHGLGAVPGIVEAVLLCTTAEFGYSINDQAFLDQTASIQFTVWSDATNVGLTVISGGAFGVTRRDTFAGATITPANWRIVLKAWK